MPPHAGHPAAGVPPKNPSVVSTTLQEQRLRGVSVDRYREYQTPSYYDEAYYTREEKDRRVTVKHVDHQPLTNGRLERHASHPNLRPRPSTASGGRRLPKTPNQPPGTIIVIENVVGNANPAAGKGSTGGGRSGRTLPDVKRAASSATNTIDRNTRLRGVAPTGKVDSTERRSLSLPRRPARPTAPTVSKEIPTGTGRRLPRTPQQAAIPLHHQNGPGGGSGRKRELPKPQSLELRHSNREFMNTSNASMGLNGGLLGRSSRSMNFPRVEGSPTHSECSSESGFLLSRQRPRPPHSAMFRSNSVSRRKLPDL